MTDYKNLIDGEMVDNGEWLEVLNPANEQVVGRVPACGKDELDRAVAAARRAFKEWKKTPQEERQKVVQGIAAAIKGNADELYRLLTSEQGKPHPQAQQEIYGAAGLAAAQSTLTLDDVISQNDDTRLSRTRRVPVGVVGGIVPWNFPIMMAIQKIVPALVAGCTIVLKPSPFTPLTTLRIAYGEHHHRRRHLGPADYRAPGHRQDNLHRVDCHGQENHGRRERRPEAYHARAWR